MKEEGISLAHGNRVHFPTRQNEQDLVQGSEDRADSRYSKQDCIGPNEGSHSSCCRKVGKAMAYELQVGGENKPVSEMVRRVKKALSGSEQITAKAYCAAPVLTHLVLTTTLK